MTVDLVHELQENGARERRNAAAIRKAMPRAPKGTKAKRGHPERDAQRSVVAWLRKAGCIVSATFTEQKADSGDANARARFGAARKASGATTGFPDLTAILPDGRICFIEMKAAKGKASGAQEVMLAELERRGCVAVLGRDIWTVQSALYQRGVVIARAGLKMAAPVSPLRAE